MTLALLVLYVTFLVSVEGATATKPAAARRTPQLAKGGVKAVSKSTSARSFGAGFKPLANPFKPLANPFKPRADPFKKKQTNPFAAGLNVRKTNLGEISARLHQAMRNAAYTNLKSRYQNSEVMSHRKYHHPRLGAAMGSKLDLMEERLQEIRDAKLSPQQRNLEKTLRNLRKVGGKAPTYIPQKSYTRPRYVRSGKHGLQYNKDAFKSRSPFKAKSAFKPYKSPFKSSDPFKDKPKLKDLKDKLKNLNAFNMQSAEKKQHAVDVKLNTGKPAKLSKDELRKKLADAKKAASIKAAIKKGATKP